jgi:hypothetical protein
MRISKDKQFVEIELTKIKILIKIQSIISIKKQISEDMTQSTYWLMAEKEAYRINKFYYEELSELLMTIY